MNDAPSIALGEAPRDHVVVRVWSRAYPGGLGVFDDNWLNAEVVVRSDVRSWRYMAFLRAPDFERFASALDDVLGGRRDSARFDPRDPWVHIGVERRADAAFDVSVRARDGGSEKGVAFSYILDPAGLPDLATSVAVVAATYPTIPDSAR